MENTVPQKSYLSRLNPGIRILEPGRTLWQIMSLYRCGLPGFRLAEEVIASRQCLQRKWELIGLMGLVRQLKPAVIVEIGTYKGGTLRCWSHVSPKEMTFISIDLPGGDFGGGYSEDESTHFKTWMKNGQTLHCLRTDSQSNETKAAVENLLSGRAIDFLFIDGDHTYKGVKTDYELYSPLVRSGGLIAFHDIVVHLANPACKVHEFWNEIKVSTNSKEIIDRDGFESWGGIGVLVKE